LFNPSAEGVRRIEPRLSGGFAWAPFRAVAQSVASGDETTAEEAATRGELPPEDRHTAGVTMLLAGRTREALVPLIAAAEALNTPSAWSDLSAAYHETALRYEAPELLADALTAADRALALDPRFPEALFNRALMIERLGLKTDARAAWSTYLAVESTGGWAGEARAHHRALEPEKPFLEILDGQYERVAADPTVAESLFARNPFGARGKTMMHVLGRWGEAWSRGAASEADLHLRVARNLAAAIARNGGEHIPKRAVAAIDEADDRTRHILAAAHVDYRAGLAAYQDVRPVDAEKLLRRAAAGFEQGRSPVALPALYFAANTLYDQGGHDEAERQIEQLLARVPDDSPAYRAHMLWQLAICHRARADWGTAISYFEQSIALFKRLGESPNVAEVQGLLAFVYDRIGDTETAWKLHMEALRAGDSSVVDGKTMSSIAEEALLRRRWDQATSFLTLQANLARRVRDDAQLTEVLLLHAVVRDRLGDHDGARRELAESKRAALRVKDPSYRASLRVAELRATAMLSTTPPAFAEVLLTEAIGLRTMEFDPASLPGLLLLRAQARRRAGNAAGALEDVEQGIEELERNRESLPEGESRWGAFHGAEELFEEGVELAIAKGDAPGAFRFAERARARALLDTYGVSPVLEWSRLPAGTVVVEFVSLPARVVIFTADRTGVRASITQVSRETVAGEVHVLLLALRENAMGDVRTAGAVLYRHLITPVAAQLAGAATAVFVPDAVTSTVPFGALIDERGAWLLRRHTVVTAPSASAFAAALERRATAHPPRTALLIAAPDGTADLGALVHVSAEMRRIMSVYPHTLRLEGEDAQFEALTRHAAEADVVHFAGHAIGDDRGFEPASILLRQDGRERRVGVAEIAKLKLSRTATVVLAGCSTARGERRAAEGVISVAHGFLSAGAPAVIATLWPIGDDAAATFFPRLHRYLAAGLSAAEALRAAQLESIEKDDVPASLWAAVQNIGS
jgi:CHAT domain-containing protein/tetratricopeptide (TPR) repeat protein